MPTPTERAFPAALPGGRTGVQASPFQFWVTGEDHLRINALNVAALARLKIRGRFLQQSDQTIQAFEYTHEPNSAGVESVELFSLGVGALLNVLVEATNSPVEQGECFVRLDVVRGFSGAIVPLGTLISGYVGSWGGRAWPGSPLERPTDGAGWIRGVQGSVPAAGANASVFMPVQTRWRLLAASATLQTSGVVAARRAHLLITHDGLVVCAPRSTLASTAGTNFRHVWGSGMSDAGAGAVDVGQGSLPVDLHLATQANTIEIRTSTSLIDAADQWSALALLVEEWRNPSTTHV